MANPAYIIPGLDGTKSAGTNITRSSLPKPVPGRSQVLVQIKAVALNYRDILVVDHSPAYPLIAMPSLVPCSDAAGTIESVGPDSKWKPGENVLLHPSNWLSGDVRNFRTEEVFGAGTVHGTLQKYIVINDERVIRAPRNLTIEEAATLPTAGGPAVNALCYGPQKLAKGDVVLTQGTGGVSCFAIQIATAIGATVIATSSSDEKLKVAKALGAQHLINYKTTPNWHEEVLRITSGKGVDHVVEVGGAQTIVKSLQSLRTGGLISVIGILSESAPADLVPLILYGGKTVRGVIVLNKELTEEFVKFIEEHDIHPAISKTFSFEQAAEALECLRNQTSIGKIIIKIDV
ncbi:putative alcohol dehydrogenase [Glonium stellatum]|uniref:Putative alcohol dehydrogenase n=1 Tax=Glonium stellatum TaxID=574774 RepID=A0A8E2EUA6_9PEZI|nr:putative alcohol dehydrogenase [Glonium stellatum]